MTETPTPPPPGGRIDEVELQTSMQRAYIDYAMAVIVGRALPDVRDGLKPVHRRVLYAMFDGGYRPDRGFSKCSRVVGDVMGQYHPHGDTAIYDTLVRLAQPWVMRAPLIHGQGNFGSPGNDAAAAMRYTECRMAPLAMEMVRDIDEETVDFQPNYDGRSQEPVVLPARFPNLLVNGSAGIAVGMATNIPPHNLREVADGAIWCLEHPDATREELQDALIERIKGPDFPNAALIVGREGIEQTYRTGRGSITQRAVIDDRRGRPGPHLPGHHRAALHGQPRQPGAEDRRAGRLRPRPGHRRRPRRHLRPHRPAPGRRAQARRRRPGGAQQPAQAHRAADQLQRQHAGAGRRRAAHADHRPVRRQLGRRTRSRSSSGAPSYRLRRGRGARPHPARPGQGPRRSSTRSSR